MTPERWARIQDLFHAAVELNQADRAHFLDEAAGDQVLRHEVEELVAAHEAPGLLDLPEDTPPAPGQFPECIGPYRLVRHLGEGGMGVVYLAERRGEDFAQQVAIKLMRAGFVDVRLELRLVQERRILAGLEHPGIARLIDGGSTPAGQPYYAMEYVEGVSLLQYCTEVHASLRHRLRLLIQVCEALEYAHQRMVVHGDVKPGNILVTGDGRPKLLDFGLARVLRPGDPADITPTAPWVTPAYASPEQLSGACLSPHTDVYALGVVLYELIAGSRPYETHGLSLTQLTHVVCQEVPLAPSRATPDATPAGHLGEGNGTAIDTDLDHITLKALAKDPVRRYCSAHELAADLRRYLDGRPVLARSDSIGYRMRMLVRPYRAMIAAAAIAAVLLAGALVYAMRQARQADRALQQSRDVTAFLVDLFDASDPGAMSEDTLAKRPLLRRAVTQATRLAGQPVVQARLLDALGRTYEALGRYDEAGRLLQRAYSLRRAAGGRAFEVASSLDHLGSYAALLSHYERAESLLQTSLATKQRLRGPDDASVAETLRLLGGLMPKLGRLRESERDYQRAVAIERKTLGPDSPELASTLVRFASSLSRLTRYAEAEAAFREALDLRRRVNGPEDPRTAEVQIELADFLRDHYGRLEEAEPLVRDALAQIRLARGERHLSLVPGLKSLASIFEREGRADTAETLLTEALAIRQRALGADHPAVGDGLADLAGFLFRQHRYAEAETAMRHALDIWRRALGSDHGKVARGLRGLGGIMAAQKRYPEAEQAYQQSLALRERISGTSHEELVLTRVDYAALLVRLRRYPEAEGQLSRAAEIAGESLPPAHPSVVRVREGFVELHEAWRRHKVAQTIRE